MDNINGKILCDGIIFDVDGTLWDSTPLAACAYNHAISTQHDMAGCHVSPQDLRNNFGKPLIEIANTLFPQNTTEKNAELLSIIIDQENDMLSRNPPEAFDGVGDIFSLLSRRYPLFIVSNCQSGYIELFLKSGNFAKYIKDFICNGDNGKSKADNIREICSRYSLQHAVYVGDTNLDHIASSEADIAFIFAAYGFGSTENPDAVINSIRELPELLC